MPKREKHTSLPAEPSEEIVAARHRRQDEDFCRALRAALYRGWERCPEGVSTEPSTKKPVLNYHPPD